MHARKPENHREQPYESTVDHLVACERLSACLDGLFCWVAGWVRGASLGFAVNPASPPSIDFSGEKRRSRCAVTSRARTAFGQVPARLQSLLSLLASRDNMMAIKGRGSQQDEVWTPSTLHCQLQVEPFEQVAILFPHTVSGIPSRMHSSNKLRSKRCLR